MNDRKPRILIIEDELDLIEVLKLRLAANGYEVIYSVDGSDGLNRARTENPDLIILDIWLPKLDGYKICRMLKFDEKYQDIPIVMLTAKVQQADIRQGKEAGADAYLTKPYKAEDLLNKIRELLAARNLK